MNKTLYVCHCGQTMDLSVLEDLFTTVGDVEKSQFMTTPDYSKAAQVAIVHMSTAQQALDCMERFNGHSMNGHLLSVNTTQPKRREVSSVAKKKRSI